MTTSIRPLLAADLRTLLRSHACTLGAVIDVFTIPPDRSYDDVAAAAIRILVEHGPAWCKMVELSTGLSDDEIQRTEWAEVVNIGCRVAETTRDAWRDSTPFLKRIIVSELGDYSAVVRKVA